MSRNYAGSANPLAMLGLSPVAPGGPSQVGACGTGGYPMGADCTTAQAAQLEKMKNRRVLRDAPQLNMPLTNSSAGAIAASTAFTATGTPTVALRLTRFVVDASVSSFLTVESITVGLCGINAAAGSVPASLYDTSNYDQPDLDLGCLNAGTAVTIAATNRDVAAHSYFLAFLGVDLSSEWGCLCQGC